MMRVGKTEILRLNIAQVPSTGPRSPGEDELPALPIPFQRGNREAFWKVNDNTGGSQKYGTILKMPGQHISATYKAPAILTADTITVKLELNDVFIDEIRQRMGKRGFIITPRKRTSNVATFSCKVHIYEEYTVTVNMNWLEGDDIHMSDRSTFRLRVGIEDRVSISDISNQMAMVTIKENKCRAIYRNKETCVGLINVAGLKTSNITPRPDGRVLVDVFFSPAPLEFPVIEFPPCGNNKASNITPRVAFPMAFPNWLHFEAKNEKQVLSLGKSAGAGVTTHDKEDITATIEPLPK